MNKLAVAVVKGADGLRLQGSVLTARHATEHIQLKSFILGAALGARSGTRTPGGSLSVSRQGLQAPLRVSVLPVPENLASRPWTTCALVFFIDPTLVPQSRAASLRQLYALTPTEAHLADLLLEGLKVSEVANRMNITLETARCNLKRVLVKTGAHRQTELMRLMLSLPGQ
jgi:DNA-binding CsgD family transcriptional regulator